MKVDLHIHTCYSPDSNASLENIVKRCEQVGIGCIAVTDHNTIEGALRMQEMARLPVIIGEEVMTSAGEIIGYFLSKPIPKGLPPQEVVFRIKDQNGLVCIPHPFANFGRHPLNASFRKALLPQIDIIEVFNSRSFWGNFSKKAHQLARQHDILQSAGSDAHAPWEVGSAYIEMSRFNGPEEFKAALREGKIVGRRNGIIGHLVTSFGTLPKKLRKAQHV